MNGKRLSKEILKELKRDVEMLKNEGIKPKLSVILVEGNPASEIYVRLKKESLESIGIECKVHRMMKEVHEEEIIQLLKRLNNDKTVHGILVQLPLPPHIDTSKIIEKVSVEKDVDGFHPLNMGKLLTNINGFVPATPKGVIRLLDAYGIEIEGKHVVIVGRSNIVGKPLSILFLKRNATVTICHSKTKKLTEITKQADILSIAIGYPKMIKKDMVKEGVVVIDIGTNKMGNKIVGDVDFDGVKEKASYITPVPGGVGPMTISMVAENLILSAKHRRVWL